MYRFNMNLKFISMSIKNANLTLSPSPNGEGLAPSKFGEGVGDEVCGHRILNKHLLLSIIIFININSISYETNFKACSPRDYNHFVGVAQFLQERQYTGNQW
jgi:hypothetical protein